MRHMASHDMSEDQSIQRVRNKGESSIDDNEENYVVVEVIQDANEEYEDEGSDLEMEEEIEEDMQEDIIEESEEHYTLGESKLHHQLC